MGVQTSEWASSSDGLHSPFYHYCYCFQILCTRENYSWSITWKWRLQRVRQTL